MSRGTRNFLIGSSLVLAVGLCTGLVAYYSGGLPLGAAGAPDEFAYLPADTSAVAYANVRAIMDSEFRKKLKSSLPTGEEQEKLKTETGIDIERDIDTVVAGFRGENPEQGGAVVLVRGRFNDGDVEFRARQHGATVEEYRGKRLVLMAPQVTGGEGASARHATGGLAFLEPGLIALGDADSIKRAIDAQATSQNVSANTELMAFVEEVQLGANAWVVGKFDELSKNAELPEHVRAQIPAVQWLAVSANVNGGIRGTLRAEARDDKAAEDLRAVVNGALAAGRMMGGQDPRATNILNSVQLTGTGKTVAVSFTLPPDMLDVLAGVAAMKGMK